jgi:HNH endonuclease/AP2 domain
MKEISLTQGKVAQVDDADFEWLSQWKWCALRVGHTWYAVRTDYTGGRKQMVIMHRLVVGRSDLRVDHRDGNGLNNQRGNLRLVTASQNRCNSRKRGGSSIYKGVCLRKRGKHWQAQIANLRVQKYLGSFNSEVEAARAYDAAARELHGEFACLNFYEL